MKIRVGSRKSPLAQAQAKQVLARLLKKHPSLDIEWVWITTTGDRIRDRPLQQIGGKGLFLKEIEAALLDGSIDLAVHSGKDVTTSLPPGLTLAVTPARADPRDVLCAGVGAVLDISAFSGRVGTGSDRRAFQVKALARDVETVPIRGNIGTRLGKVESGELDGVVLAAAGISRLQIALPGPALYLDDCLPAVGQGTLALEIRDGDDDLRACLQAIHDPDTWRGFLCERAALRAIEGDCMTPFAAFARVAGDQLHVTAAMWSADGKNCWRAEASGSDPQEVGGAAGQEIRRQWS